MKYYRGFKSQGKSRLRRFYNYVADAFCFRFFIHNGELYAMKSGLKRCSTFVWQNIPPPNVLIVIMKTLNCDFVIIKKTNIGLFFD